MLPNFMDVF
jgi:serine/threonine-protein phosphatase 2B catalytic subunit